MAAAVEFCLPGHAQGVLAELQRAAISISLASLELKVVRELFLSAERLGLAASWGLAGSEQMATAEQHLDMALAVPAAHQREQ